MLVTFSLFLLCFIPLSHFFQHNYTARQFKARDIIWIAAAFQHTPTKDIYTIPTIAGFTCRVCGCIYLFIFIFSTFSPPPLIASLDAVIEATATKLLRYFFNLSEHISLLHQYNSGAVWESSLIEIHWQVITRVYYFLCVCLCACARKRGIASEFESLLSPIR